MLMILSIITSLLLLWIPSGLDNNEKAVNILLVNCQSQASITFDGKYITFNSRDSLQTKKVSSNDRQKISKLSKLLLKNKADEIIDNACINDGFHFQVVLKTHRLRKRIFIGNSYDPRVNDLAGIFNTYRDPESEFWNLNGIPYFDTEEKKNCLLKEKAECNNTSVKAWYNDWCNVPGW